MNKYQIWYFKKKKFNKKEGKEQIFLRNYFKKFYFDFFFVINP